MLDDAKVTLALSDFDSLRRQAEELKLLRQQISYAVEVQRPPGRSFQFVRVNCAKLEKTIKEYNMFTSNYDEEEIEQDARFGWKEEP